MAKTPKRQEQREPRVGADLGEPAVWPPEYTETSVIHDERIGQQSDSDNTGKKTGDGEGDL